MQENRSVPSSFGKKKKKLSWQQRFCMVSIMLSPLLFIMLVMYVLRMYNDMIDYEKASETLLKKVSTAKEQQLRLGLKEGQNVAVPHPKEVEKHEGAQLSDAVVAKQESTSNKETLVLTTKHGKIKIVLRPDLSAGSVDYIHRLVDSKVCRRCNFYRAEKPGILQGVVANKDIGFNKELGPCPPGAESVKNDCPKWDENCGCHGPVMTRGMVAWAAGQAGGPDFFIDNYKSPGNWWGTQHTNL